MGVALRRADGELRRIVDIRAANVRRRFTCGTTRVAQDAVRT
jgi:hypothetical protein